MTSAYVISSALLFVLLDVAFIELYLALAGYAWIARLIKRLQVR